MDIVNSGTLTDPALGLELSLFLSRAHTVSNTPLIPEWSQSGIYLASYKPQCIEFESKVWQTLSPFLLTPRELNAVIALMGFIYFL